MKNGQLPLSLSRRKPGPMLLLHRIFQAIAVPYRRLPARAVGTMDPGISLGKLRGSVARMILAQSLSLRLTHPTSLDVAASETWQPPDLLFFIGGRSTQFRDLSR